MTAYYSSTPMAMDASNAHKYFQEEEHSALDDVLDHGAMDTGLDLSPSMSDRKDSSVMGAPIFSPKTDDWHSVDMQSVPSNSNNPFFEQPHSTNPFIRFEQTSANPYMSPANPWAVNGTSAAATPFQRFTGGISTDFDAGASMFQQPIHAPTPFPNPGSMFSSLGSDNQSASMGGQSMPDLSLPAAKKMRPNSPPIRSHNDLRRGDGIRKKNARFEIPAERNLSNIDQLIAQSTDEQEIKELKQQKRLLRNRQAALDSRQRKKQHTERLEDEKKQFTAVLSDMEEEVANLKAKLDQLMVEKQACVVYIENLTAEKNDMIRAHTIETGDLRKKVSVLTEHVKTLESNAMATAVTGGNAFASYGDMDDTMDTSTAWDHYLNLEPDVKPTMAVVPAKNPFTADAEKNASQGGLLFMLFLVGAFVLSSRSTPAIPRVSEDVRVASATLLDNVLKDAGISTHAPSMHAMAPQPSGTSWADPAPSGMIMSGMAADGVVTPSMLTELSDSLIRPTEEQTNEQIFSISAAQYNGVNDHDFLHHAPERVPGKGRKNLAQALAELRATNKQTGAAEVYTRTLLWDQIPSEVVRNFAKMVAECNDAQCEGNEAR